VGEARRHAHEVAHDEAQAHAISRREQHAHLEVVAYFSRRAGPVGEAGEVDGQRWRDDRPSEADRGGHAATTARSRKSIATVRMNAKTTPTASTVDTDVRSANHPPASRPN